MICIYLRAQFSAWPELWAPDRKTVIGLSVVASLLSPSRHKKVTPDPFFIEKWPNLSIWSPRWPLRAHFLAILPREMVRLGRHLAPNLRFGLDYALIGRAQAHNSSHGRHILGATWLIMSRARPIRRGIECFSILIEKRRLISFFCLFVRQHHFPHWHPPPHTHSPLLAVREWVSGAALRCQ